MRRDYIGLGLTFGGMVAVGVIIAAMVITTLRQAKPAFPCDPEVVRIAPDDTMTWYCARKERTNGEGRKGTGNNS